MDISNKPSLKRALTTFFLPLISIAVSGCNSGGGAAATPQNIGPFSGQFIDSGVSGIRYTTPTYSGFTGLNGLFQYGTGESVSFYLGGIRLGEAFGKSHITPYDLYPVRGEARNKLAQLLQSIDEDLDTSNGIQVPEDMHNKANAYFSFPNDLDIPFPSVAASPDFSGLHTYLNNGAPIVEMQQAINHMDSSVANLEANHGYIQPPAEPSELQTQKHPIFFKMDNLNVPVLIIHPNGEKLTLNANPLTNEIEGISFVLPSDETVLVALSVNGYPEHITTAESSIIFMNYTTTTVDVIIVQNGTSPIYLFDQNISQVFGDSAPNDRSVQYNPYNQISYRQVPADQEELKSIALLNWKVTELILKFIDEYTAAINKNSPDYSKLNKFVTQEWFKKSLGSLLAKELVKYTPHYNELNGEDVFAITFDAIACVGGLKSGTFSGKALGAISCATAFVKASLNFKTALEQTYNSVKDGVICVDLAISIIPFVCIKHVPIVEDQPFSVTVNEQLDSRLQPNASDTIFTIVMEPIHGVLNFQSSTGQFTYIPNHNFVGTDRFTYKASNEFGENEDHGYVTINVVPEEFHVFTLLTTLSTPIEVLLTNTTTTEKTGDSGHGPTTETNSYSNISNVYLSETLSTITICKIGDAWIPYSNSKQIEHDWPLTGWQTGSSTSSTIYAISLTENGSFTGVTTTQDNANIIDHGFGTTSIWNNTTHNSYGINLGSGEGSYTYDHVSHQVILYDTFKTTRDHTSNGSVGFPSNPTLPGVTLDLLHSTTVVPNICTQGFND